MRRILLSLLFVLLLAGAVAAHPVALGVYLPKTQVEITEPFRYGVVLEFPAGWTAVPPQLAREIGPYDADDCETKIEERAGGGARVTVECILKSYEPGVIDLPIKEVKINGPDGFTETGLLPELKLTVVGPLVEENPRPLKAQEKVPTNYLLIVLGVLLGLIIIGLLGLTVYLLVGRVRGRVKKAKPVPSEPPDIRALRRLDGDELARLLREGHAQPFYTELTAIVREYLEARFGLPAPDRTTHEILDMLKYYGLTDHRAFFRDLLDNSDYAKFAGLEVPHDRWQTHRQQSRSFVVSTKPEEIKEPTETASADQSATNREAS